MANTENPAGSVQGDDDAGVLAVDPDALRQAGARLDELGASLPDPTVDRTVLSQTTIGHPGLAAVLNEFTDLARDHQVALADHLAGMSTHTRHVAQRYEDTERIAARVLDET